jgi:hypothetical protein
LEASAGTAEGEPDAERVGRYGDLYSRIYSRIPAALEAVYGEVHATGV